MFFKDEKVMKIFFKVATYSGMYIFGPMIFLGIIGYIADRNFNSSPKFLLISIGISFLVSNVLLFKKRNVLSKKMVLDKGKATNK